MDIASSARVVAISTDSPDEVALLNDGECCSPVSQHQPWDNFEAEPSPTIASSKATQQILIVVAICMACIVGLVASVFIFDPKPGSSVDCDFAGSVEMLQTFLAFVLGWAMCFIGKRQREVVKLINSVPQLSASVCSSAHSVAATTTCHLRSLRAQFSDQGPKIAKMVGLTMVGIMCTSCICALVVSAFTAVPDETPTDDILVPETSQIVMAFPAGWMFLLSFKVRRELVDRVGSSCAMQPF